MADARALLAALNAKHQPEESERSVDLTQFNSRRPVIYVAGPMTAPDGWQWEQNIRAAEIVGFELIALDASPIVPQTMGRLFRGTYDFETWMSVDLSLVRRCDGVLLMPGWKNSPGATVERTFALATEPLVTAGERIAVRQIRVGEYTGSGGGFKLLESAKRSIRLWLDYLRQAARFRAQIDTALDEDAKAALRGEV